MEVEEDAEVEDDTENNETADWRNKGARFMFLEDVGGLFVWLRKHIVLVTKAYLYFLCDFSGESCGKNEMGLPGVSVVPFLRSIFEPGILSNLNILIDIRQRDIIAARPQAHC